MSTVILHEDTSIEVQCGDKLFSLCKGEDGSLYIAAARSQHLEVTISDDDDPQVEAHGSWVNIDFVSSEESS